MINILSIRCALAFAPYLLEGAEIFLKTGKATSQVVRQAANGFIIRSEESLMLRHQNREASLEPKSLPHFYSTIRLRSDFYDVVRTSDEVVFASVGQDLLLSHPQSEMWIEAKTLPSLLAAFNGSVKVGDESVPEWLHISGGDGRLLLSDQRSGRWVLLGADHFAEFERRYNLLNSSVEFQKSNKPPTIMLKGMNLHLQSVLKLATTFDEFAETGAFKPFEEITPVYQLMVVRATEGMKIADANLIVAVTAKEARKWAAILRAELATYRAKQFERHSIRTVSAKTAQGLWILQWGDEVLFSDDDLGQLKSYQEGEIQTARLVIKGEGDYLLALEKSSGNCVALTDDEIKGLT